MKFQLDDIEIDTQGYQITKAGKPLPTEPKVFDLIVYLIQNRDRLISRDELFEKVWKERIVSDTTLSNHIKSARKLLGDNGELQKVIKTVRARGYQFIAEVSESEYKPTADLEPISKASSPAKNISARNLFKSIAALALIGFIFIGWLFFTSPKPNSEPPYILVVPFSVSSNEQLEWEPFADQMTRELIQDLRKISGVRVVPPPSSFTFKNNKVRKHIRTQLPNVNFVLDGFIRDASDGNARVTLELENLNSSALVWEGDFDIVLGDANRFDVQAEIAATVSESLQIAILDSEKRELAQVPTSSLPAYELYVKGRHQFSMMSHASVLQSIEYFSQAIELDPKFEEAYIARTDAYRIIMSLFEQPKDVLPKIISATIDALEVNPESAHARSSLGVAYLHSWLWEDAWQMLREANNRDPDNALTSLGFALYYSAIGEVKKMNTALAKANSLDPLNEELAEWGMWALMMANEMEAATKWGEEKLKLHPNIPYPYLSLSVAEYINGNYERSISLAQQGAEMSGRAPFPLVLLAQAYAAGGQSEKVEALISEAKAQGDYMCPYETAVTHILMGDLDPVFPLLDKAVNARSNCLMFTRTDPRLEPIREDLRYLKLLETVGLDQASLQGYAR